MLKLVASPLYKVKKQEKQLNTDERFVNSVAKMVPTKKLELHQWYSHLHKQAKKGLRDMVEFSKGKELGNIGLAPIHINIFYGKQGCQSRHGTEKCSPGQLC